MRLPLLLCVTSLVATTALAQRESSPSSSPSSKAGSPGSSSQSSQSSQSGISGQSSDTTLSATGRGSGQQQALRSTKIIGAQVKTSAGEDVGRIEDVILNPTSGRIDFAVISAEGKLAPVPWQLLTVGSGGASAQGSTSSSSTSTSGTSTDASSSTSPSSTSTTTPGSSGAYASASASGMQPSFTLNVEKSKLQGGPSFD